MLREGSAVDGVTSSLFTLLICLWSRIPVPQCRPPLPNRLSAQALYSRKGPLLDPVPPTKGVLSTIRCYHLNLQDAVQ